MSKVSTFKIDTSTMPNASTVRAFEVTGSKDARFTIIALQDGTLKYYNFEEDVFEVGHTLKSNLMHTMTSPYYRRNLTFPSGGGTYVVKLITYPGTTMKNGSSVASKNIEKQSANATLTFAPASIYKTGASTDNYQTFPTTTSTGAISSSASLSYAWAVKNASTDEGGFGLKFHADIGGSYFEELQETEGSPINDAFFYYQTTHAIATNTAGDGEDSKEIIVASVTGLSVGMELFYHKATTTPVVKSGDHVAGCVIEKITSGSGTITFNKSVAFEDGETMTLRAYGSENINFAIGSNIDFTAVNLTPTTLTKTVRSDASNSQTITLEDTHGISGGNTIQYIGVGVNNESNNRVNVVTPDCPDLSSGGALDNDGQITVELAQILDQGALLTFLQIFSDVQISGDIVINSYPSASKIINLDLDKIFTPGVSGS